MAREKDWEQFDILSHLGRILNFGDTVIGFDLTKANVSDQLEELLESKDIQPVILVYKF